MMNSLKERMDTLQVIEINFDEEFVLKVKNKSFQTEVIISISRLEYSPLNGLQEIALLAINPNNDSMNYSSTTNV